MPSPSPTSSTRRSSSSSRSPSRTLSLWEVCKAPFEVEQRLGSGQDITTAAVSRNPQGLFMGDCSDLDNCEEGLVMRRRSCVDEFEVELFEGEEVYGSHDVICNSPPLEPEDPADNLLDHLFPSLRSEAGFEFLQPLSRSNSIRTPSPPAPPLKANARFDRRKFDFPLPTLPPPSLPLPAIPDEIIPRSATSTSSFDSLESNVSIPGLSTLSSSEDEVPTPYFTHIRLPEVPTSISDESLPTSPLQPEYEDRSFQTAWFDSDSEDEEYHVLPTSYPKISRMRKVSATVAFHLPAMKLLLSSSPPFPTSPSKSATRFVATTPLPADISLGLSRKASALLGVEFVPVISPIPAGIRRSSKAGKILGLDDVVEVDRSNVLGTSLGEGLVRRYSLRNRQGAVVDVESTSGFGFLHPPRAAPLPPATPSHRNQKGRYQHTSSISKLESTQWSIANTPSEKPLINAPKVQSSPVFLSIPPPQSSSAATIPSTIGSTAQHLSTNPASSTASTISRSLTASQTTSARSRTSGGSSSSSRRLRSRGSILGVFAEQEM